LDGPIPEIFVLWHPGCLLGETLARRIYSWLRPGNGLGPHVYYRSLPAPEAPARGLPLPLPGEWRGGTAVERSTSRVSNMQIVLLLIDEHLIADPAWRHWIASLATLQFAYGQRILVPVALDSTAFNVPAPLRHLNFLRPSGLPLTTADDTANDIARSLLKQLTETLCRLMLSNKDLVVAQNPANPGMSENGAAPKVKIFLSHAKLDGTVPAKRIRDYIYSQTQLAAFYDENDIPFGSAFGQVLRSDIRGGQTAALIAIRGAHYARRPWCRLELSLFRQPQLENPQQGYAERWRLNPVLVVDALAALEDGSPTLPTPGLPELGNAPIIRWSEEVKDQEEQIVTTILRDALLSSFHIAVGGTMPDAPDCIVLNWLPDPTTLLHIKRVQAANEDLRVFYPGRGLSGLELDILAETFPHIEFNSFDAVTS
jgi:hypothetical protein